MHHSTLILFLYYGLCLPATLVAQLQVSGSVTDPDHAPLPFAYLYLQEGTDTSTTFVATCDLEGNFSLVLEPGRYRLLTSMLGYRADTQWIEIRTTKNLAPIRLNSSRAIDLATVQVTASRSRIRHAAGKTIVEVGDDLSQSGGSALDALELAPAVTITGQDGIEIRGSSRVLIFINGKETRRDPASLQALPADLIERIEVITHPPARYDAEGVGGIINVIFRRHRGPSVKLEGIITPTLPGRLTGGTYLGINSRRLSFYTNAQLGGSQYRIVQRSRRSGSTTVADFEDDRRADGRGNRRILDVGLSYEPDTTFSLSLEGNYRRWNDRTTQTQLFSLAENTTQLLRNARELEDELNLSLNLGRSFGEKHKLTAQVLAGGEDEDNRTFIESGLPGGPAPLFPDTTGTDERQRLYQAKLDYTQPFGDALQLRLGAKEDWVDFTVDQFVRLDERLAFAFDARLRKSGYYLESEYETEHWTVIGGLRYETYLARVTDDLQPIRNSFGGWFPSLSLGYRTGPTGGTLGLNYSRRINRPGFFDLTPIVDYRNPLNLSFGNPNLLPELADRTELNGGLTFSGGSVRVAFYHTVTKDIIQPIFTVIDSVRTETTYANVDRRRQSGGELQLEYGSDAWQALLTVTGRRTRFPGGGGGESFGLRLRQEVGPWRGWKLVAQGRYQSEVFGLQEVELPQATLDLSVNRKFGEGRGSIALNFRDVFNSRVYRTRLTQAGIVINDRFQWQSRQLRLTLRWRLIGQ